MFSKFNQLFRRVHDLMLRGVLSGSEYARRKGVTVGFGCRIYTRSFGSEPFLVSMGDKVTITSGVKFITHDGSTWLFHDNNGKRYQKYAPIKIGSYVFVGVNSILLPGVTIGDQVVVGAGSTVTKDLASGGVYAGSPAKYICSYSEYEKKIKSHCISDTDFKKNYSSYEDKIYDALRMQDEKH